MSEMLVMPGYEGLYLMTPEGVYSIRAGKLLSPSGDRYPHISLTKGGKSRSFLLHRLIAQYFIENPHNLPCVDHIDNDKWNYERSNLQWVTHKQNSEKAKRDLLYTGPESKKLKVYQTTKDGKFIKRWNSLREASRGTGILVQNISQCCKGKIKTSGGFKWSYNYKFEL